PLAGPQPPYSREGKQRAVFVKRKPVSHLRAGVSPFAKRCCWHKAAPFCLEPAAPIGCLQVADIGDGRRAEGWRRREAPAHHRQFALTIAGRADNGRHRMAKTPGKTGRLPARSRITRKAPHGLLTSRDAV